MPDTSPVYQSSNPALSQYNQFELVYDMRFVKQYGFLRPYVKQVIYRYPWPRPGPVCLLQRKVSYAMNPGLSSKWR